MSFLRRAATSVWSPIFVSLATVVAWGCADGQSDVSEISPVLPVVDASRDSGAKDHGPTLPETSDPNADTTDIEDASTPIAPTDAGKAPIDSGKAPVDAGQVPPSGAPKPTKGEVLISEVMYDPQLGSEPDNEWFEVYNAASGNRSLTGLTILDGGNRTHVIGQGVTVAPGAYVVLVRSQTAAAVAKIPAAAVVYEYGAPFDSSSIQLANGSTGGLWLRDGTTIVAQADYGGWYSQSGSSIQLKTLTFSASAQSSNWCVSLHTWATGTDKGTPGAASDCF